MILRRWPSTIRLRRTTPNGSAATGAAAASASVREMLRIPRQIVPHLTTRLEAVDRGRPGRDGRPYNLSGKSYLALGLGR